MELDVGEMILLVEGDTAAWSSMELRLKTDLLQGSGSLNFQGEELREKLRLKLDYVRDSARWGPRPTLTVDGVLIRSGRVLLVRRGNEPYQNMHALPGGFVDHGETVEDAVVRELAEETSIHVKVRSLLGVYSHPDRDPRGHMITVAFILEENDREGNLPRPRGGDDAGWAGFISLDDLPVLAFDHGQILRDAMVRIEKHSSK